MTFVGHSLTATALAILSLPAPASPRRVTAQILSFVVLANLPDAPVSGWGHVRYDISHSLFVTLLLLTLLASICVWRPQLRRRLGGWSVLAAGAAAWLSHLLLDSFYNHGRGIGIFWPVSDAHLALPIPWFEVLPQVWPRWTPEATRVLAFELISYLPLVVLALGCCYIQRRRMPMAHAE